MFERFTRFGRVAIAQAQEEARRLNWPSVRPEHIFLGLAGQQQGVAGWVLSQSGVTFDAAREKVELLVGRGDRPVGGAIAFSPEGKKVLELALDEARRLRHNYIGTEHLLLAMFRVSDAPIPDLLQHFRLKVEPVRDLIMQELGLPRRLSQWVGPGAARGGTAALAQPEGARNNVVMCRVGDPDLEAIDTLVEAGVRATRSDAAAWLIRAGIEGNRPLFERLQATVLEIRRLREQAQAITREVASGEPPTPPTQGDDAPSEDESRPGA